MRFFVVFANDGEGVEDVSGIVAGKAVEVEEQGIEPRQTMTAVVLVPREGCAVIAQVAGEGREVMGGVGKVQHFAAHVVVDVSFAQRLLELLLADQRKLFDDVQIRFISSSDLI